MRRSLFLVPVLLFSSVAAAHPSSTWRSDGTTDGMQVERRDVPGSHFDELRVSAMTTHSLESVCDAIFAKGRAGKPDGRFKKREVLRETDTERWTYEQISVPVVSDRDYVMHVKLEAAPSSGRCEVSFETENDSTRPPAHGFVRIPCIRGRWFVGKTDDGKVSIRYEVYSDPGGGIPAFLARGGQRSAAVDFMKTILARAGAR